PFGLFSLIAMFAVSNSALINMMMASRLLYGMSREEIVPGGFAAVHARRRTPWAAIAFTTALVLGLAAWGGVRALGGTTALLLLCVFALVNVAVLVLRRQPSDRPHYRAPVVLPLFGVVSCVYLASPLSGRDPEQFKIAGVLLALGIVLWGVNWLLHGRRSNEQGGGAG